MRRQMRSQRELKKTIKRIKAFVIICRRNESNGTNILRSQSILKTKLRHRGVRHLMLNSLLQVYLFALILPTRSSGHLMTNWQKWDLKERGKRPRSPRSNLPSYRWLKRPPILLSHPIHPTLSNKGQKNTNIFPKRSTTTKRHHETSGWFQAYQRQIWTPKDQTLNWKRTKILRLLQGTKMSHWTRIST